MVPLRSLTTIMTPFLVEDPTEGGFSLAYQESLGTRATGLTYEEAVNNLADVHKNQCELAAYDNYLTFYYTPEGEKTCYINEWVLRIGTATYPPHPVQALPFLSFLKLLAHDPRVRQDFYPGELRFPELRLSEYWGDIYAAFTRYLSLPLQTIQAPSVIYPHWCVLTGCAIVSPHPHRHFTFLEFCRQVERDEKLRTYFKISVPEAR